MLVTRTMCARCRISCPPRCDCMLLRSSGLLCIPIPDRNQEFSLRPRVPQARKAGAPDHSYFVQATRRCAKSMIGPPSARRMPPLPTVVPPGRSSRPRACARYTERAPSLQHVSRLEIFDHENPTDRPLIRLPDRNPDRNSAIQPTFKVYTLNVSRSQCRCSEEKHYTNSHTTDGRSPATTGSTNWPPTGHGEFAMTRRSGNAARTELETVIGSISA